MHVARRRPLEVVVVVSGLGKVISHRLALQTWRCNAKAYNQSPSFDLQALTMARRAKTSYNSGGRSRHQAPKQPNFDMNFHPHSFHGLIPKRGAALVLLGDIELRKVRFLVFFLSVGFPFA